MLVGEKEHTPTESKRNPSDLGKHRKNDGEEVEAERGESDRYVKEIVSHPPSTHFTLERTIFLESSI